MAKLFYKAGKPSLWNKGKLLLVPKITRNNKKKKKHLEIFSASLRLIFLLYGNIKQTEYLEEPQRFCLLTFQIHINRQNFFKCYQVQQ